MTNCWESLIVIYCAGLLCVGLWIILVRKATTALLATNPFASPTQFKFAYISMYPERIPLHHFLIWPSPLHHVHLLLGHHWGHPDCCFMAWYGDCTVSCQKSLLLNTASYPLLHTFSTTHFHIISINRDFPFSLCSLWSTLPTIIPYHY